MDDNGDSDRIEGLPAGWIAGSVCVRRLAAIIERYTNADPAPWHDVPRASAEHLARVFETTPEESAFNEKLTVRLAATFQEAICSGRLIPSWFDGSAFQVIPAHAFGNLRVARDAVLKGRVEADPLWPDEWQHWSGHAWVVPKDQFESWMQNYDALSVAGLPMPESELPPSDVVPIISSRMPSQAARVPLSEAITWIAFGIALDAERLSRAMCWESLADGDPQAAQRQIDAATATLLKAGADGLVALYGRYMKKHGDVGRRTERIDPLTLEDYGMALIFSHDILYYGEGSSVRYSAPNRRHAHGSVRADHFANVTVEREALLKHCGARLDPMTAFADNRNATINRAPSVKAGRPPTDDEILAKADEMKARGLDGRTIAKEMRREPGFEHAANTTVRALIKGRWKPAGRPKKTA